MAVKTNLPIKNTFNKQERLCSRNQMELLFSKGTSRNAYPVKLIFFETTTDLKFPAQAMFIAPKRNFKKAPDRNKLKRRMREIYRLNKNSFYDLLNLNHKKMIVAFLYTGKKEESYFTIEASVLKLLNGIIK